MNENWEIISKYSWQQGVADGSLVELLKHRWPELSNGQPILATAHLHSEISLAGLMEIWNDYVVWRQTIMPTLREEDQMFVTTMNNEKIWLIDDGTVFTLLYPEDY